MRLKIYSIVCILIVISVTSLWAEPFDFQAGPIYTNLPQIEDSGKVAVVVELPPLVSLKASAFRLLVDKKEVATGDTLKPFKQWGKGLALMVCVDVSGTMKGDPLNDTRDALQSFIGKARPEDKLALITFADKARTDLPFGKSRKDLLQAV